MKVPGCYEGGGVDGDDGEGGGLHNSRSDREMDRNAVKRHQVIDYWFICGLKY